MEKKIAGKARVKQEKERKVTVNFVGDINPTEYVRKKVIQLMKEEENSFCLYGK